MKVSNYSPVFFKGKTYVSQPETVHNNTQKREIKELNSVTPDYNVTVPTNYTKLNVLDIGNNLKIHNYKLANGHRVAIIPMEGSPSIVKNYVNVGSMNETENIKGISHFLEHMAFNGTNGENGHIKLEVGDSFKKIESLGGWANASTNYAITDYVNSTPMLNDSDVEKQIEVIAAMAEDLKLSEEMIEKEKHPVCSEINMILDDPQTIALDQSVRSLFNIKNSADELVGGSVKNIKNLTRKDILDYYNKYYTPDNMNLVITGDVDPDKIMPVVAKNFHSNRISQGKKFEEKLTPITKTIRKDFINDKTNSCDIIVAFAGPKRNDAKEQIIDDLSKLYIRSHSVGLKNELKKYNAYPYISNENISTNPNNPTMNYIAVNSSEENSEKILKSIFTKLANINKPSKEDLENLKERILKQKENSFEYSGDINNIVGNSMLNNTPEILTDYDNILSSITSEDIYNNIKNYYDINKAAITLVHPKKENNISFQGKRMPINTDSITEIKLENNYDIGLYNTKSKNISYNISLISDTPYNKKPGVIEVLDEMLGMGTSKKNEQDFSKYKEKNNISVVGFASPNMLAITTESSYKNHELIFDEAKELLYNPRLTEENLELAKKNIKDYMSRNIDSANRLLANYQSQNNIYEFTDDEVLKSIDSITLDDVKDCHKYLLNNSRGIITANVPENQPEIKNKVINTTSDLNNVLPNKKKIFNVYKENTKPVVLTKANNNSQADIKQTYNFELENNIKEKISISLANSILSNSSIGLFDNLREKEHLAYSVYSSVNKLGNRGSLSCNILTTTDNKEINEISYNNIEKSIKGFNTQIEALKNGEFTEQDFNNAKLSLKASLLNNEGTISKLSNLDRGLDSQDGITYYNKMYENIDTIKKEDIINIANKIFKNPPIYSIVASQDSLDNNIEFLQSLEK